MALDIPAYLIAAIIAVESGGNDQAIGKKNGVAHEFGSMQITRVAVDDVNRIAGMKIYTYSDTFDRRKSVAMARIYLQQYATKERLGREPDIEDMARIWNGGPNGYKKPQTRDYWRKVTLAMRQQNGFYGPLPASFKPR